MSRLSECTDETPQTNRNFYHRDNDINFLMRQSSPGVPYKIVMAVPEIEVVLLQNRDLII